MSVQEWLSFTSYRQMAKWLLDSRVGTRFMRWFMRKHYKQILATEAGAAFHDWVRSQVEKDLDDAVEAIRTQIVIEVNPDGFLRVFGEKDARVSIGFVYRLDVQTPEAELLDEELAIMQCSHWQKTIYPERIIATANPALHPRTVSELLELEGRLKLHGSVNRSANRNLERIYDSVERLLDAGPGEGSGPGDAEG